MSKFKEYLEVTAENGNEIIKAYETSKKSNKIKNNDYKTSGNSVIFYTKFPQKIYDTGYMSGRDVVVKPILRGKTIPIYKDKRDNFRSVKITKRGDGMFEVRSSNGFPPKVEYQAGLQLNKQRKFKTAKEAIEVMLFYVNKWSK